MGAFYFSNIDNKTTYEIYLWPFYNIVKNSLGAVICVITKVNGTLAYENSNLLIKTLKTKLGFSGLI